MNANANELSECKQKGKSKQDQIYDNFMNKGGKSATWFNRDSGAYRFTNEPLGDLLSARLVIDKPALVVTASADQICLLAGKGVRKITAVDVSSKANAWGEYKLQAFLNLSYPEFRNKLVDSDALWSGFPFDLSVSQLARKIFSGMNLDSCVIDSTDIFQSQGYAASNPSAAGVYHPKRFQHFQKRAHGVEVLFHPADILGFLSQANLPERSFGVAYLSNVPDHIQNESGNFDFSKKRMSHFLEPIMKYLHPDGQVVVNIQWGNRALGGLNAGLSDYGFKLFRLPHHPEYSACGYMYVAQKSDYTGKGAQLIG